MRLEIVSAAQLETLARNWKPISTLSCVPRTEADYNCLVALLDEVTDEVGEDENHPLASFMDVLGTLVEDYEADFVPELA
jgi:HTH-type transcriptional regulator / antitoxin HigA